MGFSHSTGLPASSARLIGFSVFLFGGRDKHSIDIGVIDGGVVVAGMKVCACELGQRFGLGRISVRHRQKFHRGVHARQPCAQRADAARADDGNT